MLTNELHQFCDKLMQDEMNLIYSGSFSDQLTDQIIGLNAVHFDEEAQFKKIQRRTGFLIAECFQNIVRHSETKAQEGFFHTRKNEDSFSIISGNTIENKNRDSLEKQLLEVNRLSEADLKRAYLDTLTNNQISNKGGAGLGLIEMARKTKNKLNYRFIPLQQELHYFYLQLLINASSGIQQEQNNLNTNSFKECIDIRNCMLENNFFLIYKGDVSMSIIIPLLDVVENSFEGTSEEIQSNKKVFLVLTEFLQNISKHSATISNKHEGLVLIGEKDSNYLIGGVNYVEKHEVERLKKLLDIYSNSDIDSLNEAYRKILRTGDPDNKDGSSLGLIEMARRCSKMEYDFRESSNGLVKFTLTIQL